MQREREDKFKHISSLSIEAKVCLTRASLSHTKIMTGMTSYTTIVTSDMLCVAYDVSTVTGNALIVTDNVSGVTNDNTIATHDVLSIASY